MPGLTWADGSPLLAELLDSDDASIATEGTDYQTVFTVWEHSPPPGVEDGWIFSPIALQTDGSLRGFGLSPSADTTGDLVYDPTPGTMDPDGFHPYPAGLGGQPRDPGRIVADIVADEDHVVWSETDSTDDLLAFDWWVFSADTTTGEVSALGDSQDVYPGQGKPPIWHEAAPVISDGRAYWHTAVPADSPDQAGSAVVSAPLDGSEPLRIDAELAGMPAVSDLGVVVLTIEDPATYAVDGIGVLDGSGAAQPLITVASPTVRGIYGLVADGTRIAFTTGETLVVADLATREAVAVTLDSPPHWDNGVSLCGDLVHWSHGTYNGEDLGDYPNDVLDLAAMSLHRIDIANNHGTAWCADQYLAWRHFPTGPDGEVLPALTTVATWDR